MGGAVYAWAQLLRVTFVTSRVKPQRLPESHSSGIDEGSTRPLAPAQSARIFGCRIDLLTTAQTIAGRVPRAPVWMQRCGLEWLHRLAHEPRRMWHRYLVGNARFLLLLANELWVQRWPAGKPRG